MGQRFAAGMQQYIGVTDTIATSIDDYVGIATALASDSAFRERTQSRIRASASKLFNDEDTVAEWQAFFDGLIRSQSQQYEYMS